MSLAGSLLPHAAMILAVVRVVRASWWSTNRSTLEASRASSAERFGTPAFEGGWLVGTYGLDDRNLGWYLRPESNRAQRASEARAWDPPGRRCSSGRRRTRTSHAHRVRLVFQTSSALRRFTFRL